MPIPPILADQIVKWCVRTTGNLHPKSAYPTIDPNATLINLGIGTPDKIANLVLRICTSASQGVPCLEPTHAITPNVLAAVNPQTKVSAIITIVAQRAFVAPN